jgi:hypothetical protein
MPSWCSGNLDLDNKQPDWGKFQVEISPTRLRRIPKLGAMLLFMTGQKPSFTLRVNRQSKELDRFTVTLFSRYPSSVEPREIVSDIVGDTYTRRFEDGRIMFAGQYVYTLMVNVGTYHDSIDVLSFEAKANEDIFMFTVPIALSVILSVIASIITILLAGS